jgi:hypothetical protein
MKQRLSRSVSKSAGANLLQFGPPNLDLPPSDGPAMSVNVSRLMNGVDMRFEAWTSIPGKRGME